MDDIDNIQDLINLEQKFFDEGYNEGHEHGVQHGLTEGKQLGAQKGFEIWEELGFYEGFATVWKSIKETEDTPSRAMGHITQLLNLISQFPMDNPKPAEGADEDDGQDLLKLLSQIRSRYRALCGSLGVKPRLSSAQVTPSVTSNEPNSSGGNTGSVWPVVEQGQGRQPKPPPLSY